MREEDQGQVKVDDLRVAQFIHMILTSRNIRLFIETIGNKGVLILGRFSEERKSLLGALRGAFRKRGFLPIIFDFQRPAQKILPKHHDSCGSLAGYPDALVAQAQEALKGAELTRKETPTSTWTEGISLLSTAIEQGKQGKGDAATRAVESALAHLRKARYPRLGPRRGTVGTNATGAASSLL